MAAARDFLRVTPALFFWQAYEPEVKCYLSSCALATRDGLVFTDPIALADDALAEICAGASPCAIVLTNGNHGRAAARYRERFDTKVFAPVEAAGLDLIPDVTLADGDSTPGGMRVVSLPGAGPGEIALVGNGVAVVGDALINLAPEGFRRLPAKYCADPGRLEDSLRKLLSYEFDVMTFAHGAPLVGEARRSLESLLV